MPDQTDVLLRVLLAEYGELKPEQRARISDRDKLPSTNLGAIAAVVAAVLTHTGPAGLLLLAPVSLVLGWTYMRNDRHVVEIKAYLRDDLGVRLADLAGAPVLEWEDGGRRRWRAQQLVEFVTFAAPVVVALVAYALTARPAPTLLGCVWVVEALATVLFTLALLKSTSTKGARRG